MIRFIKLFLIDLYLWIIEYLILPVFPGLAREILYGVLWLISLKSDPEWDIDERWFVVDYNVSIMLENMRRDSDGF